MNSSLRILSIYLMFQKGLNLSTKELADKYSTTTRTILRDIKTINSLQETKVIYNRITNLWVLEDYIKLDYLSDEEISLIEALSSKSTEMGEDFHNQTSKLFKKFKRNLHNCIYENIDTEDITNIKRDLVVVEYCVYNKTKIELIYQNKQRVVEPLKLANYDGYWYLLVNDLTNNRVKTFYFKDIKELKPLKDFFTIKIENIEDRMKNAINAYFTLDVKPYEVKLFITSQKANIFKRKPISPSQLILKEYSDGSFDFSIWITHDMEIIPTIQKFLPYLKILSDDIHGKRIYNQIIENINKFK
ncbi:MAG: WYL domain-containing protein [Arcobacteraceae bacterium]